MATLFFGGAGAGDFMFEYITGTVKYISEEYIVVENNGIGFKLFTSLNTASSLGKNSSATIYTYMNVREDDISLFGFNTQDELNIFKLLISVSGIGPKVALSILSVMNVNDLRIAVLSDDSKAIAKANGVGAKTAQRVVLELKDKLKLDDIFEEGADASLLSDVGSNDIITETALALTTLGYSQSDAMKAIRKVNGCEDMGVEELLKAALKKII